MLQAHDAVTCGTCMLGPGINSAMQQCTRTQRLPFSIMTIHKCSRGTSSGSDNCNHIKEHQHTTADASLAACVFCAGLSDGSALAILTGSAKTVYLAAMLQLLYGNAYRSYGLSF